MKILNDLSEIAPLLAMIACFFLLIALCGFIADHLTPRCPLLMKFVDKFAGPEDPEKE